MALKYKILKNIRVSVCREIIYVIEQNLWPCLPDFEPKQKHFKSWVFQNFFHQKFDRNCAWKFTCSILSVSGSKCFTSIVPSSFWAAYAVEIPPSFESENRNINVPGPFWSNNCWHSCFEMNPSIVAEFQCGWIYRDFVNS